MSDTTLPRWSVADVHDSLSSRSFTDDMENLASDVSRLESLFEHHNVRDVNRDITDADGPAADEIIVAVNRVLAHSEILRHMSMPLSPPTHETNKHKVYSAK